MYVYSEEATYIRRRRPHAVEASSSSTTTFWTMANLTLPTRWNVEDMHPGLTLSEDGLEIHLEGIILSWSFYSVLWQLDDWSFVSTDTGLEEGQKDASSVRTNSPILRKGGVYYYEVTIVSSGQKKYVRSKQKASEESMYWCWANRLCRHIGVG